MVKTVISRKTTISRKAAISLNQTTEDVVIFERIERIEIIEEEKEGIQKQKNNPGLVERLSSKIRPLIPFVLPVIQLIEHLIKLKHS